MTVTQEIVERINALPVEKQREVLRFVREIEVKPKQRLKVFEQIDEITSRVPRESWAELPADGAEKVDEYLYGKAEKK